MSKILAIGDVHCKDWIFDKVEKVADKYDKIVFCGDFCDDWGASAGDRIRTLERVYELNKDPKYSFVMGNHDLAYLLGQNLYKAGHNMTAQLLLDSPERKHLKELLKGMPITLEIDGVTFSHAGITEGWKGHERLDDLWHSNSPVWARPSTHTYKNVKQVFGHTPQETCIEIDDNIWCIDTFSTRPDGTPIGDYAVLEIIDGEEFNAVQL